MHTTVASTVYLPFSGVESFGWTCTRVHATWDVFTIEIDSLICVCPCRSRVGVHGVDRGNHISGLVQGMPTGFSTP